MIVLATKNRKGRWEVFLRVLLEVKGADKSQVLDPLFVSKSTWCTLLTTYILKRWYSTTGFMLKHTSQ